MKSHLFALSIGAGLLAFASQNSFGAATIDATGIVAADANAIFTPTDSQGSTGGSPQSVTAFEYDGGALTATGTGFASFAINDIGGTVTLSGSVSSSASVDYWGSANGSAEIDATIDLTSSYDYTLSSLLSGFGFVLLVDGNETELPASGTLGPGTYYLEAFVSSAVSQEFEAENITSTSSADFSLELTPDGTPVPEVGAGTITGVASLALAGFNYLRRQRRKA